MIARLLAALGLAAFAPALWADALTGDVQRQPLNVSAIVMFVAFVGATLCITYWASKRNRSAADYYAAGGRITGFQNGLAIAGDYMSAASFLGISALVFTSGYDGLIYSIGFLVGWPIILFLIAERLRNLGKYTFADVASYRLKQKQIRTLSACGSLVVVAFYLIAQMVGAGKLIELLFGLNYHVAVVLVGILMVLYVLFGGMLATTWVQIIKAVLLLSGASFMAIMVLKHVNFDVSTLFSEAIKVHPKGEAIMSPGGLVKDPISAFSLGFALMFGTAGLPHILMRFFTVSDAKEARKSVFYATGFIGYFYILTFIIGFGAILLVSTNPDFKDATGALIGGNNMAAVHLNFRDRDSHFIFGDACTAVIVERADLAVSKHQFDIVSTRLLTQFSNNIRNNFGFLNRADESGIGKRDKLFVQEGRKVFKDVCPMVAELIGEHLAANEIQVAEVKRFWLHQANLNMNLLITRKLLGRDAEAHEAPVILDSYANTSSAGSVIALHKHQDDLPSGAIGVLSSFGAGYSIGSVILRKH